MASTYSNNLKIELQATGENSGTWGTITNTNLGTALEQAIVGYGNPNYASDANLTLTYTDTNAAQAARALVLNVTSGVSLTGTRELVVPTIQKQYIVQNNTTGSQSITVKTSAGTGITVPNGRKAHLYVDGTNVIYMDDYVDINGGAIDGTPIGANSAAAGTFTTVGATTGNITTVNATTVDTTNIEVTNLKAKDGTAAGSIADSTGVVTLGSSVLTTTDINGGTIDGTTIGGSSAAAGTFTTLTSSSTVTVNGGTANQVQYLNASKQQVGSANLTFDGTTLTAANFADSSLTSGRVTYAGASGNLTDSASLTFDGTTLATTTVDATNVEVTNIKAKDGTAAASIADSTGVISLTSNPTLSGGTANGVLYLNGSKVATSGSALTYNGTTFGVNFASSSNYRFYVSRGGTAGEVAAFTDGTAQTLTIDTAASSILLNSANGGALAFGVTTEQMRLTSTGLGIGTSSPASKFQVKVATNANVAFNDVSGVARLDFYNDAASANVDGTIQFNNLIFRANGTIVSTLDSSGNLGLGVTPSAWTSSRKAVQVGAGACIEGSTSNAAFTEIGANFFVNTVGGSDTYIASAAASKYNQSSGSHSWHTAASGTAGNAITFTQAATLDASGNFQVGGTTGGNRLRITSADNNGATVIARFESNNTNQAVLITFGGIYSSSGANLELGANATTKAVEIDQNKNVRVGTAAIATNATDGFLYVPTCAGTPTGTPTSFTGLAPIVIDSTNNKLYFYSGGQWRDAGP